MSLRVQAARGLKWQAIEIIGRQVVSLVVFTTIARLLDPSAFGLVGLVGVYLAFVGIFIDQGIGTALIQREELKPQHINAAFWFNVGCAGVFCLGTMSLAGQVGRFFGEAQLAPLLRWGSLALVINATAAVHSALFLRAMDFRRPMLRTLVADISGGVVGVSMALAGFGVWALIGQLLTTSVAGASFLWTTSKWRPKWDFSITHLRQLMVVSSSVFVTSILWFFASRIDQVVIGRFSGAIVLGQYVIGAKLSDLTGRVIQQPIGAVSMPTLSRVQSDHGRMCRAIYKGMELNSLVSFAAFVGLAAVAPSLDPLAFGEKWQSAAAILRLLCIYNLVLGMLVYCHPALLASGGPGRYVLLNVSCAVGAAIACIIGIRFSVHTLIVGLIINMMGTGLLALLFLRQRIGLNPWHYCRPCLVPAVAASIMFVIVWLIRVSLESRITPWTNLGFQVFGGACVYLAVIYALASESLVLLWDMMMHAIGRRTAPA